MSVANWELASNGEFICEKREKFAQALSRGMNVTDASVEAGIAQNTGLRHWSKNPKMLARADEIRKQNPITSVNRAALLAEAVKNIQQAREAEQYKASNDAIKLASELLEKIEEDDDDGTGIVRAAKGDLAARLGRMSRALPVKSSVVEMPDLPDETQEPALAESMQDMHTHDAHDPGDLGDDE